LDMRKVRRGRHTGTEYLVKWFGFTQEHNKFGNQRSI
jgi:hypothetical protein